MILYLERRSKDLKVIHQSLLNLSPIHTVSHNLKAINTKRPETISAWPERHSCSPVQFTPKFPEGVGLKEKRETPQ